MATATVADYLLGRLRDWGVDKVFGFPGDGINGILAAWGRAENDPKFVQARHEEMAHSRPSAMRNSPAASASAWPLRVPARSTC